ncbi:granzyme K-like [Chanos chanos]|uniref:Granzyme K-like n=1 Tax=Chanos chanos TaxID=29144 RepID=A0A6J2UUZ3_CHACN|nr:granzyme K-like [Chanos chanos]
MHIRRSLPLTVLFVFSILELADSSKMSIIGGKDVKPHSKPWMASIQLNQQHKCGGILIKDQWVLTAAHCKMFLEPKDAVTVLLGAHSLRKEKGTQRIKVKSFHPSGTFSVKTKQDDIMLIKLETKFNKKVGKVKVWTIPKSSKSSKDVSPGSKCSVTGWGLTSKNVPSDTLKEVKVTIMDRDLCSCYYNNKPTITQDMLCAGNKAIKGDACQGDSGGPLECNKKIVGLVSGGHGCGDPKKPGVYTRLSNRHLDWINKILKHQANITHFKGAVTDDLD